MVQISILIVNYNTEKFITQFLIDITQQTFNHEVEIIITNNVQNQHLHDALQQANLYQNLNIRIISSEKNIGFGRAMNLAAQHAQGQHLFIANPDLRMLQTDYLEKLVNAAEKNSNYGIITSQLINDDGDDKSEFYNFEFNEDLGINTHIKWFSGAALLLRKNIYQQVSGFDPDFFMYCEDEDLCLRIQKLHLNLIKINELKIYHKGGSSEPYQNYDFFYRWYRSQLLFAYKHFSTERFELLIDDLQKKSKWKTQFYKIIRLILPTARHHFQYAQWSAMRDVIAKTTTESTAWLSFRV